MNLLGSAVSKIAIYGGTFNPIHYGHLIPLLFAFETRKLEKVIFVPNNISPFKTSGKTASAADRYHMTELALKEFPNFEVSDYEIAKGGTSFSVDTVAHFCNLYGTVEVIMGQDTFASFANWKDPERILEMATILVIKRTFIDVEEMQFKTLGRIVQLSTPNIEISSTLIRERLKHGKAITYLTPPPVEKYILSNGLFI